MENGTKRVAFVTLGCKLNFSETSAISREFTGAGYLKVEPDEAADVYVINTCSVTEHADKKCRQTIRKLQKQNREAYIIVTGCYAQLKPEEILDIPGVDLVVGANEKGNLFKLAQAIEQKRNRGVAYSCESSKIEAIYPAYSQGERTRSFLKVQDGCDYCCSYCTIPLARGKSRNIPIADLVKEAEKIAASGIKEIVITGVNTGDFGRTTGESFWDLLKALESVEGIERYRISSIEPNLLKEEVIRWIASGTKFQNHFHIPLQSGCDAILAKMRRRYNTTMFAEKIDMIRSIMGDVFFGIDVIAGFPGESDDEFEQTFNFLKERIKPAFIHVFPFSARKNTPAAEMPNQVKESIKSLRVERLTSLAEQLHSNYCNRFKGTKQLVLFESEEKGGKMFGYTGNYIRVERSFDASLIGKIVEVEL